MTLLNFKKRICLFKITKLQDEGILKLEAERSSSSYNLADSHWYLLTIAIGVVAVVLVFNIPPNAYPWIYARNILSLIFVFSFQAMLS